MKKLLFFGYTLEMGGAEKVLIDFLKVLKPDYEIDLVLLQAKGELLQNLPEGIQVQQIRNNPFSYFLFRYISWFRKKKINRIASQKDYQVAVGFFEGRSATWVADIEKKIRRIAWVHNDVEKFDIGIGEKEIKDSYQKMDQIVLVSEEAKRNFAKKYQISEEKLVVLYNLIDEEKIKKLAEEPIPEEKKVFTFVNVGKMRPQKRQDRLIEIASRFKKAGYSFQIQIIGNGPEEEKIKSLIKEKDVSDVVQLLGLKVNPYPYVKKADCFVLTSDFEGFGIAVKEALLLGTPVISTNVTGVKEVLANGEYGILCEINTDKIEEAMREMLDHPELQRKIRDQLTNFDCENGKIIEGLRNIIEGRR